MGETGLESLHWVFILTPLFPSPFCRTISGNVDGKKGNAPETHGTRNGTHGDVGKVDMCVLNPAPRNPGWKWGRGRCFMNSSRGELVKVLASIRFTPILLWIILFYGVFSFSHGFRMMLIKVAFRFVSLSIPLCQIVHPIS